MVRAFVDLELEHVRSGGGGTAPSDVVARAGRGLLGRPRFLHMLLSATLLAASACGGEPAHVVPEGAEWVAVKTLTFITVDEGGFRQDKWLDLDRDGVGQFASLGELLGVRKVRGPWTGGVPAVSVFRGLKRSPGGDFEDDAYRYRLFLPSGETVGTNLDAQPEGSSPTDENLAETFWVCYAWPKEAGSGSRAFVAGPDGFLLACEHGGVPWGPEGPSAFSAAIEKRWGGARGIAGTERPRGWHVVRPE